MARILLGVSGGIAAYKALEFARLATKARHVLRVLQTESSLNFVGRASFEAITGAPALISEFERDPARGAFPDQPPPTHDPIGHLEVVANADLFLIAPATANTLAKLASGQADGMLTAAALAAACPVIVAPAMNNHMYEHPATQANIQALRRRGVIVLEPGTGELASKGEWGVGRLSEPAELLTACETQLSGSGGRPLDGLKVLVTAGGTQEPIDSVRYIGNRSSGKMGFAIAQEAYALGADVSVIAANVSLQLPDGIERSDVSTAAELAAACEEHFPHCDVLVMTAAVADYRPSEPKSGKLKKNREEELTLSLGRTEDILAGLAQRRTVGQTLVGFAAECGEGAIDYGREKLTRKGLDLIVVNDVARSEIGFGSEDNEVTLLTTDDERKLELAPKREIARQVLERIRELREQGAREAVRRSA